MPILDPWLPSGTVPASRPATPVAVYRHDGEGTLTPLPNVRCVSVRRRIGPDPGMAQFRYAFDGVNPDPLGPQSVEQALSTSFVGPHVVEVNDRLVVRAQRPDLTWDCVFDGFALAFGMHLDQRQEMVTIAAVGVAKRARDTPIGGALMRDADHADDPGDDFDVATDLVAQFNPRGVPNATPEGSDTGDGDATYPVFLDPTVVRDPDVRRPWDLAMCARHLMFAYNGDEAFVANMDPAETDAILVSREPAGDDFDPSDPSTYSPSPIVAPDTPITGKDWPSVLDGLVSGAGFGTYFVTAGDFFGNPSTSLVVYDPRLRAPKPVMLQARGSTLDPALSNVGSCGLVRDLTGVANEWVVQGGLVRHEASFVLAPGFPMSSGDAADAVAIAAYDRSSSTYLGADHDKYRLYVLDETGEGHYAIGSASKLAAVPSLDLVLGEGEYVVRRRRPIGELVSLDGNLKPYEAQLSIALASNYSGDKPGVYDSTKDTGTPWVPVLGGWSLLRDRLGVRLTVDNPNGWKVAVPTSASSDFPGGGVNGVERQATSNARSFLLRLTCVVEADVCVAATAGRRDGSPLPDAITRLVDARDRYRGAVISRYSQFNDVGSDVDAPVDGKPYTLAARDDTDAAQAEADAMRAAADNGAMEGPVVIPRFTRFYELGDRISSIEGRNLSLRTNTDSGGDAAAYPQVVAIAHSFEPEQRTELTLSDSGGRGGGA